MKTAWDEYLGSEEYMDEITPDFDEDDYQRNRGIQWFSNPERQTVFWDKRLNA